MKQVTQHNKTGEIKIAHVPIPAMKAGHVLVRTQYSVISAGTERASVESRKSSLIDRAKQNPELIKLIIEQVKQYGLIPTYKRIRGRLDSYSTMGYSAAGTVVAIGSDVEEFRPGDRVACAGAGYASHAEYILIPKNLCASIPNGVSTEEAAYTTIGSIALQGVRQASATIGEIVIVIGLGLIGQITVQLLKANGCAVVGIDMDPQAVILAKSTGADIALNRTSNDVKKVVNAYTKGVGADAVIITAATKSEDPVKLAGELCRERGRVILVGDVGLKIPRGSYYAKELDFRMSRSYGPGRYDPFYEEGGRDYPIGFVRWTENRNMQEFLRLLDEGKIDVEKLTTHRFKIDDAKTAYSLVVGKKGQIRKRSVGVIIEYKEDANEQLTRIEIRSASFKTSKDSLNVGFIGAGSFAQASLLPPVQSYKGIKLIGVCTGDGISAKDIANQYGFRFATTSADDIFNDDAIGTVFIATRHNLHASMVEKAIKAGKHVFVEKPLAMDEEELKKVTQAYYKSMKKEPLILMVGFNRRFAPQILQMMGFFKNAIGPVVINYRVNAGLVPRTHWTRDHLEGGGRIIGEVCHFVDLIQYLVNSTPVQVFAVSLGKEGDGSQDDDSISVTIKFKNGSIGTINYLANGDSSVPKEYIEIFSTGRVAIIDNFKTLQLYQCGSMEKFQRATIDKGHREEVYRFLSAIRDGKESPIDFNDLVIATCTTFAIHKSLELGIPISL